MQFIETGFKDLWLLEPDIFQDERGYFFEAFNARDFKNATGFEAGFVQQNQSKSMRGVLRGMHLQIGEAAQAKLVHILKGKVLDVVVDLRKDEPTFGDYYAIELSGENQRQLYVPRGMAHGFLVLEEETLFSYSCDNYYNPKAELTLRYDDPNVSIDWPQMADLNLSAKDQQGLDFEQVIDKMYG